MMGLSGLTTLLLTGSVPEEVVDTGGVSDGVKDILDKIQICWNNWKLVGVLVARCVGLGPDAVDGVDLNCSNENDGRGAPEFA